MRGSQGISLPESHVNILLLLVTRPGEIHSVDALAEAGWNGDVVTNNGPT